MAARHDRWATPPPAALNRRSVVVACDEHGVAGPVLRARSTASTGSSASAKNRGAATPILHARSSAGTRISSNRTPGLADQVMRQPPDGHTRQFRFLFPGVHDLLGSHQFREPVYRGNHSGSVQNSNEGVVPGEAEKLMRDPGLQPLGRPGFEQPVALCL